jgi:D-alanyl-D-alanine carboxypeptidase
MAPSKLIATLDAYLARAADRRGRRGLPAPQVLVMAPDFEYTFGDQQMPFHAASIGKLATAALVMQEVELGRVALDASVTDLLPASVTAGLFTGPGATVEQLLAHTSGIADYFEGKADGPRFIDIVVRETDTMWQPDDLLAFTRDRQRPVGAPGQRFAYSDTGYVLLGRILEELTGVSFTDLLRSRIFGPAGMTESVLWLREPGPAEIAPLWLNGVEASQFRSVSCDWAGGGIVSTLSDLARLGRAMADGTLVTRSTYELMTTARHRFRPGIWYGLGAMELRYGGFMPLLRLPRAYGHLGVLGTHLFGDEKSTIVMNFHDTREMRASFQTHVRIQQGLNRLSRD